MKIKYKGYEISQAENNHIMICKDDKMLFHAQCGKKKNEEELKKSLEFYLNLTKSKAFDEIAKELKKLEGNND